MAVDFSQWRASKEQVEAFYTTPFDAKRAQAQMVARLNRTVRQLNGDKVRGKDDKDYETLEAQGVVFRPTLNGMPIEFTDTDDENGFHTTREQLLDMIPHLIAHVEDGALDAQLQAALESDGAAANASEGEAAPARRERTSSGKGGAGKPRQSSLPSRADGLPHRVPGSEPQPHESYVLNKSKKHWRSPEQIVSDEKTSAQRKATIAAKG